MTLAVAFLAGPVSCVSPCVLPVMPVYTGHIAGGAGSGWSSGVAHAPLAAPAGSSAWRAIGFLPGFLGVSVIIWASVGLVGFALLSTVPLLRQVAGGLTVAMGMLMIAGRHPTLALPARVARVGAGGPALLSAGVAVGWMPCIGPTLGAILALAASAPTVGPGLILFVAYAAGLSGPLLIVLVAMRRFRSVTRWLAADRRLVDVVARTLVAGVGILVFSGAFARLAGLFTFGVA